SEEAGERKARFRFASMPMQKLTHLGGRPAKNRTTGAGLLDSRAGRLLDNSRGRGLNHDLLITALGLVLLCLLGWINLRSLRGLNFEFFYLLACCVIGWVAGARSALVCTILSAVCLYLAESLDANSAKAGWLFACNSVVRFLAFAAIAWVAGEAGRLTRQLEQTVEQRTQRLQSEVEQHKTTGELLNEAVELFEQVVENIADVFWVTDPGKTQVEYVSRAFEGLW